MRWLAYAHPAAMLAVLALGVWVLREGLLVRRARIRRRPFDAASHRRAGRWFVGLAGLGFASGLASMTFLRDEPVFDSVHALLASGALLGLLGGGALGLRLERGPVGPGVRLAHALLGSAGLLLGLAAGAAGIAILP